MNWANRLTVSRLVLTILFVAALNSSWQYGRTTALILFLLAGITDFIDGEIARRYQSITNFGKLMDPLVDKIMMAAAFISLVPLKGRSGLGGDDGGGARFSDHRFASDCGSERSRPPLAERLGKQKTSWQVVTVVFFLALLSISELHYADERSTWWFQALAQSGADPRLDYGRPNRLFRSWLRLAPPRLISPNE